MKKTEFGSSEVRKAATSALRSRAGAAVCTSGAPSSAAMMWAREVLPSPGGPERRTWSSGSPRRRAASMKTASWSVTASCATKSARRGGRSERSSSSSGVGDAHGPRRSAAAPVRRARRRSSGRAEIVMPRPPPSAPRRSGPRAFRPRRRREGARPPSACSRGRPGPRAPGAAARRRRSAWPRRRGLSSSPATFSRSSTITRSAVRLPTPGTAWKRLCVAERRSPSGARAALPPERIAIATLGPTPETELRWRKRSRSSSRREAESCMASSRTTRCA